MEEFERLFVQLTIAQLKHENKPVWKMIKNLKAKNPELGDYAKKIAPAINSSQVSELGQKFQQEILRVCNESDNPQETAKNFFAAMHLTPEQAVNITKQLRRV